VTTIEELIAEQGRHRGWSEWFVVDQQRVDAFADVTLDHQFIHVDPERAAATPFGGTIAHGFLTMSLMVHLAEGLAIRPDGMVMGINYGFDRLRFLSPVPVGSEIRLGLEVAAVEPRGESRILIKYDVTVEIRGSERPALVAEWLAMVVLG
jgi:acyl dehydratase